MKLAPRLPTLLSLLLLAPIAHAKPVASRVLQKHAAPITALAYSPDGKTLASADEGGRVKLTDVSSGKTKLTFCYKEKVAALAYSPNGKILAVGRAREVRLLNPQTVAAIRVLKTQMQVANDLGFSADSKRLIVTENDPELTSETACSVWDVSSGKRLQRHSVKRPEVQTAAISPDGKTFVAPNPEKFGLSLWSVATGQRVRELVNEETAQDWPYIGSVAFSPDGKLLAGVGSYMEGPGHLTMWTVATGKPKWGRTFSDFGSAIVWAPDGKRLAVDTSYDTTYDDPSKLHKPTGTPIFFTNGQWQCSLQRTDTVINAIEWSPAEKTLAIDNGRTVRLYNVAK